MLLHNIRGKKIETMTDPAAAAAAAGTLTNMRGDNDNDKQAKKTKRKEAMDALCARRKARKAEERKLFFAVPWNGLSSRPLHLFLSHAKWLLSIAREQRLNYLPP